MTKRILIVDDHGLMRAGLRALLEDADGMEVAGEASSAEACLAIASELRPDIVLMDIGLPGMNGIEATRRIKSLYPEILVLILTVNEEESLLREAIAAGASGYIIKRAAEEDLTNAIQAITQGYLYVHPAITHLLVRDLSQGPDIRQEAIKSLTPRELEVMKYIIRGFTNRQISETLFISIRTVEGHRSSLFGKLGLRTRVELVEFAEKKGLLE